MTDTKTLAQCLCRDFPNATPSADRAWRREPALRVIDCVLSLRRNYDRFVVPRLDRFEIRFPSTRSVQDLRHQMDTFREPAEFVREVLDYRDLDRARILDAVVDRVLEFAQASTGSSELERLERWAAQARPDGYHVRRIRGFALAGYQYLRMLFGANTTKPDLHICRYVSRAIGRTVSDLEALNLLEGTSAISEVRLRDLDTSIWEASARSRTNPKERNP
jgi:hypothetical protein